MCCCGCVVAAAGFRRSLLLDDTHHALLALLALSLLLLLSITNPRSLRFRLLLLLALSLLLVFSLVVLDPSRCLDLPHSSSFPFPASVLPLFCVPPMLPSPSITRVGVRTFASSASALCSGLSIYLPHRRIFITPLPSVTSPLRLASFLLLLLLSLLSACPLKCAESRPRTNVLCS